jgi:hypothetical protein
MIKKEVNPNGAIDIGNPEVEVEAIREAGVDITGAVQSLILFVNLQKQLIHLVFIFKNRKLKL